MFQGSIRSHEPSTRISQPIGNHRAADATTELASPSNNRTVCTRQPFRTEQSSPRVDANGTVGASDLLSLLAQWGTDPGVPPDFDGDGSVGASDLLALLANWGPCL